MEAREATANNADLWARYLRDQWSAWPDPLGLRRMPGADGIARAFAEAAAAGVAVWLTVIYAQPIGRLYSVNEPDVTRFVEELAFAPAASESPAQYTERPPVPSSDRHEGDRQRELTPVHEIFGATA